MYADMYGASAYLRGDERGGGQREGEADRGQGHETRNAPREKSRVVVVELGSDAGAGVGGGGGFALVSGEFGEGFGDLRLVVGVHGVQEPVRDELIGRLGHQVKVARQHPQLRGALVVFVQVGALESDPRVRLVHRHRQVVVDVLHDEVLPDRLELVPRVPAEAAGA